MASSILLGALALKPFTPSRRQFVTGAGAALGAEAGWLSAVGAAAAAGVTLDDLGLPPSTTSDIAAGRIVAIKNWMPEAELSVLRADARAAFAAGHYKADALATYGQKNKAGSAGGFDAGLWRVCSLLWVFFASFGIWFSLRNLQRSRREGAPRTFPFSLAGFLALWFFQVGNALLWQMAWPYFLALTGNLAFAFVQFMSLVNPTNEGDADRPPAGE